MEVVAIVANYMCDDAIAAGRLVPILEDWVNLPESGIYVVHSGSKYLAPKTQVFKEFLVERLKLVDWI